MTVSRRFVLKGMALGSMAGLAVGRIPGARASTGSIDRPAARPILALVNGGAAESVFLRGASAASGPQLQIQRVGRDLNFMRDFERRLRSNQAMRVIGLLDDASAALVVEMARSAGARVQWLGQHNAEAGFSRHHLVTTAIADGCSRQLSRQLHTCGAGFSFDEEHRDGAISLRRLTGSVQQGTQSAQWAASVGHLLASLGGQAELAAPRVSGGRPVIGSFVSFSINA